MAADTTMNFASNPCQLTVMLAVALLGSLSCNADPHAESIASLNKEVARLNARIDSVVFGLAADKVFGDESFVSLREESIQDLSDGFMVADLGVAVEPGGARVSGRLINTQSVGHRSANFKLSSGRRSNEFTVMYLPAGGSSRFRVLLLDANPDSLRFGRIEYVRSTVTFQLSK